MKILDSHVHFWDLGALRYPWIEPGSPFDRTYAVHDYRRACAAVPVAGMIFIEADADAACSLREAQWAQRLSALDPGILGIVARVALTRNPAVLGDLDAVAAMPLVKGIRDNIQGHSPGFATQAAFVHGVREVGRRGLHFELCLEHRQLEEALELAGRCPEVSLVLDHCAKPDIRHGAREPWLAGLRRLAGLPHVVCKISGLVTEADWARWQPQELLWYARQAAEAFGPQRILFGSDWPVCEAAGGFTRWLEVAQRLTASWSRDERESFFCRNAERVYRLV
jgi:predicted TIM-barrel fold metal-dependent hydrolase